MGRRGPAPLPTALKLLHGETRPSRVNHAAPAPAPNRPRMPADLEPAARAVWRRVLREQAPGVILAAHADVFRVYCEAVARYSTWSALLAGSGPLMRGARGHELVRNPLAQMVRDCADQIRLLARELGLTPSALAGVQSVEQIDPDDPMAALLDGLA